MYRPQFAYPDQPGFEQIDTLYYFDYQTVPLLNNTSLASLATVLNIPLVLQTDYPFLCRGVQIKSVDGGNPAISAQFKDPYNNYLSNDYLRLGLSYNPNFQMPVAGFLTIPIEPEIRCVRGATWWMSLFNHTLIARSLQNVRVSFFGVKQKPAAGVLRAA